MPGLKRTWMQDYFSPEGTCCLRSNVDNMPRNFVSRCAVNHRSLPFWNNRPDSKREQNMSVRHPYPPNLQFKSNSHTLFQRATTACHHSGKQCCSPAHTVGPGRVCPPMLRLQTKRLKQLARLLRGARLDNPAQRKYYFDHCVAQQPASANSATTACNA